MPNESSSKLRRIRRKVEDVRYLLEPMSREAVEDTDGVQLHEEEHSAHFFVSDLIERLKAVEDRLREAGQDPENGWNRLV